MVKTHKIFSFFYKYSVYLIVFILSFISCFIFDSIHTKKIAKIINENIISSYNVADNNFSFAYFDKDLQSNIKDEYIHLFESQKDISNSLNVNNIKVLITEENINTVYSKITNGKISKLSNNTNGVYLSKYKLIILKHQQIKETVVDLTSLADNAQAKALLEQGIKEAKLKDIVDIEQLDYTEKLTNKITLFHEVGHYLDDYSKHNLKINPVFYINFLKERDTLMYNTEPYFKNNINEYIAQCISYRIVFGSIESQSNLLEANSSNTSKYINNLLNEYIKEDNNL